MDRERAISRLRGCYITLPTMFRDTDGLPVDPDAIRRHVRFLIDAGVRTDDGVLLAIGAAGDFSALSADERLTAAEAVVAQAAGAVPKASGAQTTRRQRPVQLAAAAGGSGPAF